MKAKVYSRVVLTEDVWSGWSSPQDRLVPRGTRGTVVECYEKPCEGYAVDVEFPDETLPSGYDFDNIILRPEQFDVLDE